MFFVFVFVFFNVISDTFAILLWPIFVGWWSWSSCELENLVNKCCHSETMYRCTRVTLSCYVILTGVPFLNNQLWNLKQKGTYWITSHKKMSVLTKCWVKICSLISIKILFKMFNKYVCFVLLFYWCFPHILFNSYIISDLIVGIN